MLFKANFLYLNFYSFRLCKDLIGKTCSQIRFLCDRSSNGFCRENRNLKQISDSWVTKLRKCGIDEPELSVKHIVEKALAMPGITRNALQMMNIEQISPEQEEQIQAMCTRRLNSEPIQYIVGDWDFRHLTLITRPPIFIPRQETEELVEFFTSFHLKPTTNKEFKFLEVGSGTGAISLSVLVENPQSSCVAIDRNSDAVALTKLNAKRYDVEDRITVIKADIENFNCKSKFDAVISNPPYIPKGEMESLQPEVKRYEDYNALCGGDDGMDIMKMIFNAAPRLLKPNGLGVVQHHGRAKFIALNQK